MKNSILSKFKNMFKTKDKKDVEIDLHRISLSTVEALYNIDDLPHSAIILRDVLEVYGEMKKKNHRYKGREFIYFLLSNKHKDLKNVGYKHWQNMDKIVHLNHNKVYKYHKDNLRNAIDFFKKEIKSINSINVYK